MVKDPKLPPLQTVSEWVYRTRQSLDITLTELGEEAHLSPSQLSRLENEEGNPSYEAVYRVYRELRRQQKETSIESVLKQKREHNNTPDFEYVMLDDTCKHAARLMEQYSISQLPVIENEKAIGGVTETALMEFDTDLAEVPIAECSLSTLPEVPVTESRETIRNLLRQNAAVLLTQTEDTGFPPVVGSYVGLVTAADFR